MAARWAGIFFFLPDASVLGVGSDLASGIVFAASTFCSGTGAGEGVGAGPVAFFLAA